MKIRFKTEARVWYEIIPSQALHDAVLMEDTADPIERYSLPYQHTELGLPPGLNLVTKAGSAVSDTLRASTMHKALLSCIRPVETVKPTLKERLFKRRQEPTVDLSEKDLYDIMSLVMTGKEGTENGLDS